MSDRDEFLTERQKEILEFIIAYHAERGVAPTLREICEAFGYSSYGTAHKHLRLLEEKGYLRRKWNQKRGLEVNRRPRGSEAPVVVPMLGWIAAGRPIEAADTTEPLTIPGHLVQGDEEQHYVLRVDGSSMIDDGIFDGDLVVVRRQEEARSGEMVVALLDGEVTLKRIYSEGRTVRLQPANPSMEPIIASAEAVQVQGVVVGLMRRY